MSNDDELTDYKAIRKRLKRKSTPELIRIALTLNDEEDNQGWAAISTLHERPTRNVFEAAKQLCASDDPIKRRTGIYILAQLGWPTRPFLEQTLEIFFHLIDTEQDSSVLSAIGSGLGHISPEPRKVTPLLKLKNHCDVLVRLDVVFGLLCEEDDLAIQALIELSTDEDEVVRDWATFGLGSQTELNTPQIREALYQRAIDFSDDGYASGEGLVGLVNRNDERVFALTLKRLQLSNPNTLVLEAAKVLADSRLYSALVKLRDDPEYGDFEKCYLEAAITACTPNA